MKFLRFIRQYGPVAKNDNMYDETIRRSAKPNGVEPIKFEHPAEAEILGCFGDDASPPVSVILTGTAGDGKTHLLRHRGHFYLKDRIRSLVQKQQQP